MSRTGYKYFLQGAALQGGLGELAAIGHLSIMVNDLDQSRARDIIMAYDRGDFALEEND